jgi:hypothetical protein
MPSQDLGKTATLEESQYPIQTILQSHSNEKNRVLAQKSDMKTSGTE